MALLGTALAQAVGSRQKPGALRKVGLSELVSRDLGDNDIAIEGTHRDERTGVLALPIGCSPPTAKFARGRLLVVDSTFDENPVGLCPYQVVALDVQRN